MAVVVFDMDDTLYDEMTYVQSGFSAVAEFLSNGYGISSEDAIMVMNNELMDNGRGQVFDSVLKHFNIWSKYIVLKCLAVYRTHTPDIRLLDDALECLSLLMPDYPMYLVTDGNKMVQNMKVKALGIEQYMKYCFITHRYGIRHSKPSPYVFHKIADREKVDFNRVMYIGDNPNKDFVGIKTRVQDDKNYEGKFC